MLDRKTLAIAGVLTAALATAAPAQIALRETANDPVTGLAPAEWERMVGHMLNGQALVGDAGILVVSSLPESVTLSCDRWQLVGTNPYTSVRGNPVEIKPFSITYIKTREFDGYCKNGVVGHASMGKTVVGHLDAANGSFKDSTVILLSGARR